MLDDDVEGLSVDPETGLLFDVVVNHEEQYSLWPADDTPPAGWKAVGKRGSKEQCLQHIEQVWTDMRPRSLRERQAAQAAVRVRHVRRQGR